MNHTHSTPEQALAGQTDGAQPQGTRKAAPVERGWTACVCPGAHRYVRAYQAGSVTLQVYCAEDAPPLEQSLQALWEAAWR